MAELNLFPARAAIGTVNVDGEDASVYMTPEFFRALTALLERVGGPTGPSNTTLEITSFTAENQAVDLSPIAEIAIFQSPDSGADVAQALQQIADQAAQQLAQSQAMLAEANKAIEDLQAQISSSLAKLAEAAKDIESLNMLSGYSDPFRVNWERPGAIGALTAAPATFTAITTAGGAQFLTTNTALTNGAGAALGTLTNAPAAGNPTKWIGILDNGVLRYIPAW